MAHQRLQLSTEGDVTIARFRDHKILDEANIQQLGEELSELARSGEHKKLLLNFDNVEFLSSAALGKLISVKKKAAQSATALKLCSIRPEIFEVFRITNLDQVFEIADNQEEALAGYGA